MPTIGSKEIIADFLKNDGVYPGDPPAVEIIEYVNDWGNKSYHVAYSTSQIFSRNDSPYVHEITILWNKTLGVTAAGKALIKECRG